MRFAIVDQLGTVVNAVVAEAADKIPVPRRHRAIGHDTAGPGWRLVDGELRAPTPQEPATDGDRITRIEAAYPVTQRMLREALLLIGERFQEVKDTPGYQRAAQAEALIAPLRTR